MGKCDIIWNEPPTWDGCRASTTTHFIVLDYDPVAKTKTPFCYDVMDYIDGNQSFACFSDVSQLRNNLEKIYGVNVSDFER